MVVRWLLAAVHLLALGIGLGAVWVRGRALSGPLDAAGLRRVFSADSLWGIAALLWIGTGLARLLGGAEKPTAYYVHNDVFRLKMALFIAILLLEIWPMVTLIRWRIQSARGASVRTDHARGLGRISFLEAALVVAIVFAATAMARGYGL
jgi:putative membrane protein